MYIVYSKREGPHMYIVYSKREGPHMYIVYSKREGPTCTLFTLKERAPHVYIVYSKRELEGCTLHCVQEVPLITFTNALMQWATLQPAPVSHIFITMSVLTLNWRSQ